MDFTQTLKYFEGAFERLDLDGPAKNDVPVIAAELIMGAAESMKPSEADWENLHKIKARLATANKEIERLQLIVDAARSPE